MSGFDRIKAPAKRLSERDEARQPDSDEADTAGRAALFSASGVTGTAPRPMADDPPPTHAERERPDRSTPPPRVSTAPPPAAPSSRGDTATNGDATPPGEEGPNGKTLPSGKSLLQVECGHCGITCPMPLGVAVKRAFPLAVLVPMKSHPVFATCPCGERRAWLKPSLGLPK